MNEPHSKEWYAQWAEEHGYKLGKMFDKIYNAMIKCDSYCPCKYAIYQKQKPEELNDILCPCIFVPEDMEKKGHCHCRMFEKGE